MTEQYGNGKLGIYFILWGMFCALILLTGSAKAADNDTIDGDTGILYVNGVITRSTCNLDSDSRRQLIDLGAVSSGELQYPGERGTGRMFHLHLHDCFDPEVMAMDTRTGNEKISDGLPSVRVSFMAAADVASSQLIAVRGITGMGLRLEDEWHRLVKVNEEGVAVRVAAGEPILTYYLIPERTRQPLSEGAWHGTVYMRFSYD